MSDDPPFLLGEPGPMRDGLLDAVRLGKKTATSALLAQYEAEDEPLPTAGERRVLIDSAGHPTGWVMLTEVTVMRLGEADDRLAHDEGEGFADVAAWRSAHEHFWRHYVMDELPAHVVLDDHTEIVVERFRYIGSTVPRR